MAKSRSKSRKRDTPEAKRWLIVGAHQAGASEKHVARISGLSTTAVRNIILNYQKTGTPSIPEKIPTKVRQKLVVEYDENGDIINTDSEEEEEQEDKEPVIRRNISTKEIINYALSQLRIPSSTSTNKKQQQQQQLLKLSPPAKFEQNIRGYEEWTHEDDMVLLNHVLHHLHGGGWTELEARFNGRHAARLCYDRWKHLRSLLIRGITDKPNTPW